MGETVSQCLSFLLKAWIGHKCCQLFTSWFFWPHLKTCGILVPDEGLNLHPLQWKLGVLVPGSEETGSPYFGECLPNTLVGITTVTWWRDGFVAQSYKSFCLKTTQALCWTVCERLSVTSCFVPEGIKNIGPQGSRLIKLKMWLLLWALLKRNWAVLLCLMKNMITDGSWELQPNPHCGTNSVTPPPRAPTGWPPQGTNRVTPSGHQQGDSLKAPTAWPPGHQQGDCP